MGISRAAGIATLITVSVVAGLGVTSLNAATLEAGFELFGTVTVTPTPGVPRPFDTLVKIDPQTGGQTLVGPVGAAIGVSELDAEPATGILFGTNSSSPGDIYRIDPETGSASIAAHVTAALHAVAFAPDGTLFAIDWSDFATGNVLGTVDLATQTFRPVMRLPAGIRVDAIDFAPNGLLYAIYVQQQPFQQWLVALDVASQSIVSQNLLGTLAVGDMDYATDGFIYHSNFSHGLFRIDPAHPVQQLLGFGEIGAAGGLASISMKAPIRVDVDVKPGAFPNVINPCSAGVVPVAILSTTSFDAGTVDPTTLALNNARARAASLADVDRDGDVDLVVHVPTQDIGLQPGDLTVTLRARTFAGAPVEGTDSVKFVGSSQTGRGARPACPR
jgi:hypothetical protein